MTMNRQRARAVELLTKVVESGWFDRETIAGELVVPERRLVGYLTETEPMPLDRQLCLALFVIDRLPPLARQGHRLLGQVRAAMAFSEHRTATHLSAPPQMLR